MCEIWTQSDFAAVPFGGAWQKSEQNSIDPKIPVSTHILMHSAGLERLLAEVGYKAATWQIEPLEIDENGAILGQFATDNDLSIGNVSGKTDLLEFLTSQVEREKIFPLVNGQMKLELIRQ